MLNPEWDPYQTIQDLLENNYEMARCINDQAATIEKLIHNAKRANQNIQELNQRLTEMEIRLEIS